MDVTESFRRHLMDEMVPTERAELEETWGQVWDTRELQDDFVVHSFLAPFISVTRKNDGVNGALMFQHHPRFYFNFTEDRP